jgi:hypothetical protein
VWYLSATLGGMLVFAGLILYLVGARGGAWFLLFGSAGILITYAGNIASGRISR